MVVASGSEDELPEDAWLGLDGSDDELLEDDGEDELVGDTGELEVLLCSEDVDVCCDGEDDGLDDDELGVGLVSTDGNVLLEVVDPARLDDFDARGEILIPPTCPSSEAANLVSPPGLDLN